MPAASRALKSQQLAEDRDAIVTVGRPKEKKRKRDKTADISSAQASTVDVKGKGRGVSPSADVDDQPLSAALANTSSKPFDYSAVPNGLDQVVKQDNPNKLKKAKKVKKRTSRRASLGAASQERADMHPFPSRSRRPVRRFQAAAPVDGRDQERQQEHDLQVKTAPFHLMDAMALPLAVWCLNRLVIVKRYHRSRGIGQAARRLRPQAVVSATRMDCPAACCGKPEARSG